MFKTTVVRDSLARCLQLLKSSQTSMQKLGVIGAETRLRTPRERLEMRMMHKTSFQRNRRMNSFEGNRIRKIKKLSASSHVLDLPKAKTILEVIHPVEVPPVMENGQNIGADLTKQLDAVKLKQLLSQVQEDDEIRHMLQLELHVDGESSFVDDNLLPRGEINLVNIFDNTQTGPIWEMLQTTMKNTMVQIMLKSFVQYCSISNIIPPDLHVCLHDLIHMSGNVTDLLPFIINHGRQVYPHVDVMEELKHLCVASMVDPINWFPKAREMKRKVIYHCGPTNSGKTYAALQRFMEAETGIYLAPLRLLAIECFTTTNSQDVECDLLTGERKYYMVSEDQPSNHKSCTIELLDFSAKYDVAVIDEIQMIGDLVRGGHWTMALLGLLAEEIHVCGDGSALNIVESLVEQCGDAFEVKQYERKTPLVVQKEPLGDITNVKPGDCIVCFSIAEVFGTAEKLRSLGHNCALIYGALPPGVKIKQTEMFNDPNSSCNILVATDAVGMGLNLSIQRMIFSDIKKVDLQEVEGELIDRFHTQIQTLSTTQAKQIAGRAGRYGGMYEDTGGEVTTFHEDDLKVLSKLLDKEIPDIKRAGLTLRENIVETFAYYLPGMSFSRILMLFIAMCETDQQYFMCDMSPMIKNAMLVDHIQMPLTEKFTFCRAPMRHTVSPKGIAMFIQMARHICEGRPMTLNWFLRTTGFDMSELENIRYFSEAVEVFHLTDVYLWLSFKFDLFQTVEDMREFRIKLDKALRNYLETNYTNINQSMILNQLQGSKNLKNFIASKVMKEEDDNEEDLDQIFGKSKKNKKEKEIDQKDMGDGFKFAENDVLARIWYGDNKDTKT